MLTALKSEFRKLYSVRSTYVILLISMLLLGLFAFYIPAFHSVPQEAASPLVVSQAVTNAIGALNLFCAIVGVLLITHEYRYNTIVYTLTANKSRTRVLLAKLLAITVFAVLFAAVVAVLSPLLNVAAYKLAGYTLVPQTYDVWSLLGRAVFNCWGMAMIGAILAFLIRSQVGALAALFILPGTVESILGLLLHQNQVYLPYSALGVLLDMSVQGAHISYVKAVSVAAAWIVGGLLLVWFLFKRRDAN